MFLFCGKTFSSHSRARFAPVSIWLVLVICLGGCVQRRMTIRTNPPGALVYVDDYEIGITPVSTDFLYYGQRKIRLVKDGYETETFLQNVPAPWYQYPPLDFVTENLVPGEIRDQRVFTYQLTPQMVVPTEHLRERAEGLRRQVQATSAGVITRPGPATPVPQPVAPPAVSVPETISPGFVLPGHQPMPSLPPASSAPPGGSIPMHTLPPGGWSGPGR